MNRRELRQLSEIRYKEASALYRAKCYGGAYYLAGYSVECALKACIARKTRRNDFPDKKFANEVWTHDLTDLLRSAGLKAAHQHESARSLQFNAFWTLVKDWSEASRYELRRMSEARELLRALDDPKDGVLRWVRKHW
ncbi:MAG: HEPN domain-containing protein [Phycisphaerales bacterium]|nr:HEPN domain-containing protein [Phycisphaerales bacterium]